MTTDYAARNVSSKIELVGKSQWRWERWLEDRLDQGSLPFIIYPPLPTSIAESLGAATAHGPRSLEPSKKRAADHPKSCIFLATGYGEDVVLDHPKLTFLFRTGGVV